MRRRQIKTLQFFAPALSAGSRYPAASAQNLAQPQVAGFCALTATRAADPWLREALIDDGPAVAARRAFEKYGRYRSNEVAWRGVSEQMLEPGKIENITMADFKSLLHVLASEVEHTRKIGARTGGSKIYLRAALQPAAPDHCSLLSDLRFLALSGTDLAISGSQKY